MKSERVRKRLSENERANQDRVFRVSTPKWLCYGNSHGSRVESRESKIMEDTNGSRVAGQTKLEGLLVDY